MDLGLTVCVRVTVASGERWWPAEEQWAFLLSLGCFSAPSHGQGRLEGARKGLVQLCTDARLGLDIAPVRNKFWDNCRFTCSCKKWNRSHSLSSQLLPTVTFYESVVQYSWSHYRPGTNSSSAITTSLWPFPCTHFYTPLSIPFIHSLPTDPPRPIIAPSVLQR